VRHVDHLLPDYHDGELLPHWCRQIERHLARCPSCRAELERLRHLSQLLAQYSQPEPLEDPDFFQNRILLRLRSHHQRRSRSMPWVWFVVPVGLVSVLLVFYHLLAVPTLLLSSAGWLERGADTLAAVQEPLGIGDALAMLGDVAQRPVLILIGLGLFFTLEFALFIVFFSYLGWIRALIRSDVRVDRAEGGKDGSL
jgi:predicted anti-sigma-YlaC factor YlaD